ncbi:MAG: hypothetical protein MUP81_01745 [Dehalococcoidia bacterium]|nr:hypothetical protein [Dehalococcoidia bacterium]
MPSDYEIMSICDDRMADILDNHRDDLDAFIDDETNDQHIAVKIYITLALANHLILKGFCDGNDKETDC